MQGKRGRRGRRGRKGRKGHGEFFKPHTEGTETQRFFRTQRASGRSRSTERHGICILNKIKEKVRKICMETVEILSLGLGMMLILYELWKEMYKN